MDIELAKILGQIAEDAISKDKNEIPLFLHARKIEKLYHFTSIENLESIAKFGLLGRSELSEKSIKYRPSDLEREEPILNGICCSFTNPNKYMLNNKIARGHNLVILEFEGLVELLTTKKFVGIPGNFGSSIMKNEFTQWPENFIGGAGLSNLFLNQEIRDLYDVPDSEPTDPQSEIIFLDSIPWNSVKTIYSPKIQGYADQNVVREVLKKLPGNVIFQSQSERLFESIDWKNPLARLEFENRKWNKSWLPED
jgi:hypothetical protein